MVKTRLLVAVCCLAACSGEAPRRDLPRAHAPRFADYPADSSFAGPAAPADLASSADARRFRTVLRAGAAAGPNFAGHLTVVTWGCGTQCRSYAIIDARTGRVYADSALDFSCHAPEYRRESRLVVQRADSATFGPCSRDRTRYFRWAGERLVEIPAGAI